MIRVYDTKKHEKVDFSTKELGKVGMYVCGPTVYNYIHIGNARTFVNFDMIRRYFEWRRFEVTFVQNITDVDDKIINKANEEGVSAEEVATRYTKAFIEDMTALGVKEPSIRPKATEEIDSMISLIERLIDGGHAYAEDGDVYFSVRSYDGYGELSGRNIDEMEGGHRELRADGQGLEERKHDPLDFALWKAAKPGEPSWESPWGQGRPGWHIECSAMSDKYLGLPFDIHGGGSDLVFPHHENERAQSEAACDCTFANYWLHSGMLRIDGEKMSKSLGNFLLLRDILKTTRPETLRLLMAQTHYRSPMDFSKSRVEEAEAALSRIENAVKSMDWGIEHAEDVPSPLDIREMLEKMRDMYMGFIHAMDDDFNAPRAVGGIFEMVNYVNAHITGKTLSLSDVRAVQDLRGKIVELCGVLGIDVAPVEGDGAGSDYPETVLPLAKDLAGYEGSDAAEAVDALLQARADARAAKDWGKADAVRDGLAGLGFTIEDTAQGARVSFNA